jgi:hypothetical protein
MCLTSQLDVIIALIHNRMYKIATQLARIAAIQTNVSIYECYLYIVTYPHNYP